MKKIKKTQLNCSSNNLAIYDYSKSNKYQAMVDDASVIAIDAVVHGLGPIVNEVLNESVDWFNGYDPKIHSMAKAKQVDWATAKQLLDEVDADLAYEVKQGLRTLLMEIIMRNVPDDGTITDKW